MRKLVFCILSAFLVGWLVVPIFTFAERSNDEIYSVVYDDRQVDYDIWNYINNELMPAVKNSSGGVTQAEVDEIKDSVANVQTSVDNIDVQGEINDFYESKTTSTNGTSVESVFSFTDKVIEIANAQWKSVASAMTNVGATNEWGFTLDPASYNGSTAYNIFRSLGYSLVLVFFAVNLIETTIKYEIFTLKGGLSIFGRLLVSKFVIDMSGGICVKVLEMTNKFAEQVISLGTETLELQVPNFASSFVLSELWIVGDIIDIIQAYIFLTPALSIAVLTLGTACLVSVKLILRSFELSLLVVVSPAFFACFSTDVTKPYFKSFIVTFLQVAVQLLFMAVVYFVGTSWLVTETTYTGGTNPIDWFVAYLPNMLILLSMAILMIKPPKALTGLIR